jgi:SAM-dependent methyltransferase
MPFFSKIYGSWKETQEEKYEKIMELLGSEKIDLAKGRVLDVGCGPFFFEKFLNERGIETENFICVDVEKQKSGNKNFILGDGEKLPVRRNSISLSFCLDSLHLIEDLASIRAATKKGGLMVISSFFSETSLDDVELSSARKLNGFKILKKAIIRGRENEIIMLCKKE